MKIKSTCFIFFMFLFIQGYAHAQDAPVVEIQKVGGRSEAVVPSVKAAREKPTTIPGKIYYTFETGILKIARTSSAVVGKITQTTIWGFQKTSDVLFSPIIKTLDVKRWLNKKQMPSRESS